MSILLIWKNLAAHPLRSLMTTASVALAVFLVCMLQAVVSSLRSATSDASNDRLWVQSAVSLYVDMPLSYESKIASVDGVERVCRYQWFGGRYGDGDLFFAQFAVDPQEFLDSYPEFELVDGSVEPFLRERTRCLVGRQLMEQLGKKVGDTITLEGTIFPRADGAPWEFQICGVYRGKTTALDEQTMYFPFDYLAEGIEKGDVLGTPGVGVYMLDVADDKAAADVMNAVDALFANGPQKVQTTTEAEFARQFVSMLGNVPLLLRSIGAAILFALFLAILNTMLMAARERTRDFGVLKALGFSDGWIFRNLTVEALVLCAIGAALGVAMALGIAEGAKVALASFVQGFAVSRDTVWTGLGLALALGLVAGVVPAWGAARARPVEALRAT